MSKILFSFHHRQVHTMREESILKILMVWVPERRRGRVRGADSPRKFLLTGSRRWNEHQQLSSIRISWCSDIVLLSPVICIIIDASVTFQLFCGDEPQHSGNSSIIQRYWEMKFFFFFFTSRFTIAALIQHKHSRNKDLKDDSQNKDLFLEVYLFREHFTNDRET